MFGDDIVRALWKHRDKRKEMVVGSNPTTGAKNKIAFEAILFFAPNAERNPNFFQGKSASGFGLNPAPRFRPPDGEQNRNIFSTFF